MLISDLSSRTIRNHPFLILSWRGIRKHHSRNRSSNLAAATIANDVNFGLGLRSGLPIEVNSEAEGLERWLEQGKGQNVTT